jgi:membrane protease subunit (stomatin/prohibitin family)
MGIFNTLKNELIDIIEWIDDSKRTLVWRFPRHQNEIKNGAKLIVRPGQSAIFVREGQLADVFEPGSYELSTKNLPLLGTLAGWKYGFESPFKAEVYFVSTRTLTDLKWGTPNPVMLRDADFGPVRLRAFGNFTLRAIDPKALLRELTGTDGIFEAEAVGELLRSIIASAFADVIGEAQVPALDLASRYAELAELVRKRTCERIDDEYGLEVPALQIVNIALPESVEKALDTRSEMGVIGDLGRYQQYQMANAIGSAATSSAGGGAAEGLGLGLGIGMAGQMLRTLGQAGAPGMATSMGAAPPPPPVAAAWHVTSNGQTFGPFTPEQMAQGIARGEVQQGSLVWTAGFSAWMPAGQVPQLASLFGPPPPPPPPPPTAP